VRVVLDTNAVISRHIAFRGTIARIFRLWDQRAFDLVVSNEVIAEYARVLQEPAIEAVHGMSDEELALVMAGFATLGVRVTPFERLDVVAADVTDNRIIECAVAGEADYIVTGDKHLMALGSYRGIQIITPAIFVKLFSPEDEEDL
jgi:uncharacterized protein